MAEELCCYNIMAVDEILIIINVIAVINVITLVAVSKKHRSRIQK